MAEHLSAHASAVLAPESDLILLTSVETGLSQEISYSTPPIVRSWPSEGTRHVSFGQLRVDIRKQSQSGRTDIRALQWCHGRAINVIIDCPRRIFVHILGFQVTLLGHFVEIHTHAPWCGSTGIHALDKAFRRLRRLKVLPMGLYIAEEFKSRTGWRDTAVAVKHGAGKGIKFERAAILAAARPLVALGTTSALKLRGARELVSLLGVTAARSSWVTWVEACSGSTSCTADWGKGIWIVRSHSTCRTFCRGLEGVVVLDWGGNTCSTHGCEGVIIHRLLDGRLSAKGIVLASSDTGK